MSADPIGPGPSTVEPPAAVGPDPTQVLPAAGRGDLAASAVSGARWLAAGQGITEVVAFAVTIVLSRLLSPGEYGLAAAAIVFPTLAEVLLYEGFGTALVRRADATQREAGVAMTLSLVTGVVLCALVAGGAFLAWPDDGDQRVLVQLSALAFLLSAPNVVPQALQQRRMAYRLIATRETIALLIGTGTTLVLALAGAGGAAIIGGLLVRRLAVTVLLAAASQRIGPGWDRQVAREVIGFGTASSLAGILVLAKRNVDYLILSFLLPARTLGFYYRAYSIGVDYQGKVTQVATRMAVPLYSRATDVADMFQMRRRLMRVQMALVVPILGCFAACAAQVIPVVFGDQWDAAIVPAQILVAVPISGMIGMGTGPMLMAAGRPGLVAISNGASLVLYAATVWIAVSGDLVELAIIVVAFNLAFTLVSTWILMDLMLGQRVAAILEELWAPLVAIAPTVALAWVLDDVDATVPLMLAVLAGVGAFCALTYGAIMRFVFRSTWDDVVPLAKRLLRVRRGKEPAAA